jgi:hypothetical protein
VVEHVHRDHGVERAVGAGQGADVRDLPGHAAPTLEATHRGRRLGDHPQREVGQGDPQVRWPGAGDVAPEPPAAAADF